MSFLSLPHPVQCLQDIGRRGGRVVWVNPRRTESAGQLAEHVFIRPDSDVFFMLAFLNEVLARGAVPSQGIGASAYRQLVAVYLDSDGAASLEPNSGLSRLNGIVVEVTKVIAVEQLPAAVASIAWPDASTGN